jgi:hypothetical protein
MRSSGKGKSRTINYDESGTKEVREFRKDVGVWIEHWNESGRKKLESIFEGLKIEG